MGDVTMKESPILFSAPMVRALLDGTKTQTRRVVKRIPWLAGANADFAGASPFVNAGEWRIAGGEEMTAGFRCPYGAPGDRLWVKETWSIDPCPVMPFTGPRSSDGGEVMYLATDGWDGPWRPSIHMSRWASRITLEITDVRVQRLHQLTRDDILAEGVRIPACAATMNPLIDVSTRNGPSAFLSREQLGNVDALLRAHWAALWCAINGRPSWDANPWVWALTFKRVSA